MREGEVGNRPRDCPGVPGYPGREAGLGHVVAIQSANQRNGLRITPETAIPEWYGDRMDPEMVVDMLMVSE